MKKIFLRYIVVTTKLNWLSESDKIRLGHKLDKYFNDEIFKVWYVTKDGNVGSTLNFSWIEKQKYKLLRLVEM